MRSASAALTIFGAPLAEQLRLQRIDETHRDLHSYLTADDECYFAHEYTSGKDYSFGDTNNFISNLKKSPKTKGTPQYKYRLRAISRAADTLSTTISEKWLRSAVLVPVPPSKAADHPEYDDRMLRICQGIRRGGTGADVREIVRQRESRDAAHQSDSRPTPDELVKNYEIDESKCLPVPAAIGIVDDVLTAGTHFRAMRTVLSARFPGIPIVGFFLARRIRPEIDFSDIFPDLLD